MDLSPQTRVELARHLPVFDGYPYLVTALVGGLYHFIVLPGDLGTAELLSLARRQHSANRLRTCLVIGADDALYVSDDGGDGRGGSPLQRSHFGSPPGPRGVPRHRGASRSAAAAARIHRRQQGSQRRRLPGRPDAGADRNGRGSGAPIGHGSGRRPGRPRPLRGLRGLPGGVPPVESPAGPGRQGVLPVREPQPLRAVPPPPARAAARGRLLRRAPSECPPRRSVLRPESRLSVECER